MRNLKFKDVFTVQKILKKIGFEEFKEALAVLEKTEENQEKFGMMILESILDFVIENIDKAEKEILNFLGDLYEMTAEEFENLDMFEAFEKIMEIKKEEGFINFTKSLQANLVKQK